MNRRKKLKLNTIVSIVQRLVTVICGFILPRLFLSHFGSDVNGLVSSIGSFLTLITIFDSGMGVVIEASLYKPLAENNKRAISRVLTSGQRFYNKLVIILAVYIGLVAIIYPACIRGKFDYFYTFFLVLAISISSFGQYCLGVTNGVLLSADQKGYISYAATIVTTLLNTIIGVILIKLNFSVQVVKFAASIVFLCRPFFLALYVKKHYEVNWKEPYTEEPIKQKWNGFAQHVAAIVVADTDVVVLTLFSDFKNVSIYQIYFLVISSIKSLIVSSTAGIKSLMGNMIARKEWNNLENMFSYIEWILHTLISFIFSMICILIVPFVKIYTRGVTDTDYLLPSFAIVICLAYAIYCYRIPYLDIIMAAGKFKEIQMSAIIEAIVNIVISVIAVFKYGLIGVAIGTLVAMSYRLIYLVVFLSKNILNRKLFHFAKNILIDIVTFTCIYSIKFFMPQSVNSYVEWIKLACKYGVISAFFAFVLNLLIYHDNTMKAVKMIIKPLQRRIGK